MDTIGTLVTSVTFWTAVASVASLTALLVSLWPHIVGVVRQPKIAITPPRDFNLHHYIGFPQLDLFLDIRNTGDRDVTVGKITGCMIYLDDGGQPEKRKTWTLPDLTYFWTETALAPGQNYPQLQLGRIRIGRGEHWQGVVRFYRRLTEEQQEAAEQLRVSVGRDLRSKVEYRNKTDRNDTSEIEADEELVKRALDFFQKNFDLVRGRYRLCILAITDDGDELSCVAMDFVLYESSIVALREVTTQYKWGGGLVFPILTATQQSVSPRLLPASDEESARQKCRNFCRQAAT